MFQFAFLAAAALAFFGGGPENVLVVVNDLSDESIEIAKYYILKRDIPRHHVVHVKIPGQPQKDPKKPEPFMPADVIPGGYDGYKTLLEEPVKAWLEANKDAHITTIVLTRGIPVVSIAKGGKAGEAHRSTAHFLALLYSPDDVKSLSNSQPVSPIHGVDQSLDPAEPVKDTKVYCVGMLNAFNVDDVKHMIDQSLLSDPKRPEGTVYLGISAEKDPRGMYNPDYPDLQSALKELKIKSEVVPFEKSNMLLTGKNDVIFFQYGAAGWDIKFPATNKYLPGSVVDNLTSYGLVPRQFIFGDLSGGQTPVPWFLRAGASAVQGCVAEPTTVAWDRNHMHLRRYAHGYNLIESYYMGHPWLPWMNLVCGDPLMQPYAERPVVKMEAFKKIEEPETKKVLYTLEVSAKATRAEANIGTLTLFIDGVKVEEVKGDKASFQFKQFDPDVNSWTVVATDDSKYRTQGFTESPPIKKDASKIKAFLDGWTKTSMKVKLNYDGREPVVTWYAPGAKEPFGTKRGREISVTFAKEGPHTIDIWVKNAKAEPSAFFFDSTNPKK